MNELDKYIKSILSCETKPSEKCEKVIEDTLKNLPEKQQVHYSTNSNKMKLSFAVAFCSIFLVTGIVFANEIVNAIKNIFNFSEGIDKAVENGYIEQLDLETTDYNDIKITAENMLMDDFNLSFTFKISSEKLKINESSKIEFGDMIITDENNNILYCDNKEIFDKYCEDKNLKYVFEEYNNNYISTGTNYHIQNDENGQIKLIYNLYANKFPKSKKLYIDFFKIRYMDENNEEVILNEKWNIEVDVPEKFYNRNGIVYTVTKCNDPSINIIDATVYNTGTRFEFTTKFDPIYNEDDTENVKKKKEEEYLNWVNEMISQDKSYIDNEYIEDCTGHKYYPIESSTEDARTTYKTNGEFIHWQTFNLTQYDELSSIKIHFNINTPYESRQVIIELERK